MSVMTGRAYFKALVDAGVFTEEDAGRVTRVVIDVQADRAVVMHVQFLGDDRLLDVVPTLAGVEIRRGGKIAE